MGWRYCNKPKNIPTIDFLRSEFSWDYVPGKYSGQAIVNEALTENGYFAIAKFKPFKTGLEETYCLISFIQHNPRPNYNIGYKEMCESMAPGLIPPAGFFQLIEYHIPDPEPPFGSDWREMCRSIFRQRHEKMAQSNSAQLFGKGFRFNPN